MKWKDRATFVLAVVSVFFVFQTVGLLYALAYLMGLIVGAALAAMRI